MRFLLVSTVLCVAVAFAAEQGRPFWNYEAEAGPAKWAELFGQCSGQTQSPIDIDLADKDNVVYDETLTNDLDLMTAKGDASFHMVNNAHTVYTDVMAADITMTGLQLGSAYRVVGPHFHWGADSTSGSEHTLAGKQYPLEMHIVTYNVEKYGTLKDAVMSGMPGAIAVIGVFFEVGDEDNAALEPIVNQFENVKHGDKSFRHEVKQFSLTDLLPAQTGDYFRYDGSLTTPSCEEVVRWTVMNTPNTVSEAQLEKFRSLEGHGADDSVVPLVNNFRPVQPLNNRQITRSFIDPKIRPAGRKADKPADKPAAASSGDEVDNASSSVMAAVSTVMVVAVAALML